MSTSNQITALSRVAAAFGHPLRIRILETVAATDQPLSPSTVAELLERPVNSTSYHVRRLVDAGLLTLVDELPRRGAVEHLYRPVDGVEEALQLLREAEEALG